MRTRLLRFSTPVLVALALVIALGHRQQAAAAARVTRDTAAVQRVLASPEGRPFRYFPHQGGTDRCAIPFVFRSIRGTCTTRVALRPGNSGQIFVNFSEQWPWSEFHYSGTPRRTLHHHWIFDLLPSGKVVFVRRVGDFPPNDAR